MINKISLSTALAVATAGLGVFSQTAEAFTVLTDRTAWENAISGSFVTDTFDNDISQALSITFDSGVVSTTDITSDGDDNSVVGGVYEGAVDTADTNGGGSFITWTFPNSVSFFGFDLSVLPNLSCKTN